MKRIPKRFHLAVLVAFVAAVALPLQPMAMPNENPQIIPNVALPHGTSYGEWGAAWWQWALSTTLAESPVLDTTGEFCGMNQTGKVWFLAGTFGTSEVRHCTIPAGSMLFVPIVNAAFWVPEDGPDEATVRALAVDTINLVDILEAEIDGVPVINPRQYRGESSAYALEIPPGSIFTEFGYDPGVRFPAVSDGYYLMLAPLSAGHHTIHFRGGISSFPFETEVTYHLNVTGPRRNGPGPIMSH